MIRGSGDLLMAEQRVSMREHLIECLERDYRAREPHQTPEDFQGSLRDLERRKAEITAAMQADKEAIAIYQATKEVFLPPQLRDLQPC